MAGEYINANLSDAPKVDGCWLYTVDQLRAHLNGISRALGLPESER
jgi:hypothetical protein